MSSPMISTKNTYGPGISLVTAAGCDMLFGLSGIGFGDEACGMFTQ